MKDNPTELPTENNQKKEEFKTLLPTNNNQNIDPELQSKLEELRSLQEDTKEDPFEINSYIDTRKPIVGFFDNKVNIKSSELKLQESQKPTPKEQIPNEKYYKEDKHRSLEDFLKFSNYINKPNTSILDNFLDFLDDAQFNLDSSKGNLFNNIFNSSFEHSGLTPNFEYSSSEISITLDLNPILKKNKIESNVIPKFYGTLKKISPNQINLELTMDFGKRQIIENIVFRDLRKSKIILSPRDYNMSYKYDAKTKIIHLKITLNR